MCAREDDRLRGVSVEACKHCSESERYDNGRDGYEREWTSKTTAKRRNGPLSVSRLLVSTNVILVPFGLGWISLGLVVWLSGRSAATPTVD